MSDSPDSDNSAPSLSSYPPAFVSLITTFIKRAEEAETRAHKSLVILKAKDDQVLQLQQRLEILEKIACRIEEVVPPLNLPKSPQLLEDMSSSHSRDVSYKKCTISNPPLETLYKRCSDYLCNEESSHNMHNCYEKCQTLIDGLERSNFQLREALTKESEQRVKEHEQYITTLNKLTQAFKELQNKNLNDQSHTTNDINASDKTQLATRAAGDFKRKAENKVESSSVDKDQKAVVDKLDFKNKVSLAESIISVLKGRLETQSNKRFNTLKLNNSRKSVCKVHSKRSSSSFHSPKSSTTSKFNRVHISSHYFLSAFKKQNKKLKHEYQQLCDKYLKNLSLCEKLQNELTCISSKNKTITTVDQSTQTALTEILSFFPLSKDHQDKLQSSRSINILQGRLEAAAKVMSKQCKQIQNLHKQLGESLVQVDSLKKRLARAESTVTAKEVLGEAIKKQLQDIEKRNSALIQEGQLVKDTCSRLRQDIAIQIEECAKIKREKEMCESQFQEMKSSLETKLLSLSSALQKKEQFSDQMSSELQNKLSGLREQFVGQVKEASDRLVAADFKIQELYLGIETFLKLLFTINSPELSPSSQAQAIQVASDILQLPTAEVQTILHTSRCDLRVNKWIRECNRMVHEKVFAKTLGNLLLDAVFEARVA